MSKILCAALAVLAIGAAGPAIAADAPSRTVNMAETNFRDSASVKVLYSQLRRSAQAVCDSNSANPRIQQADQACVDRALDQAIRAASRPTLTALHNQVGPGPQRALASQDF